MMDSREKYRAFCEQELSIPAFSQAWWLDSVVGKNSWDVIIVEKKEIIVGVLPYVCDKLGWLVLIKIPKLTQTLGPWIRSVPDILGTNERLSYEKEIMEEMIRLLPKFSLYEQNWNYRVSNWIPFYWAGFSQTTRYTYVLENIKNHNLIHKNFSYSKRKDIKKAQKIVSIKFDINAKEFYDNHKLTLAIANKNINYSYELFERIYSAAYLRNKGKTIAAYDSDGNLHAALFVVWDQYSAYNLISTIDPRYRTHGAATLLVQEIIRYTSQYVSKFDFEGSMIESVEKSFRQFDAKQIPYFCVRKSNSIIVDALNYTKQILKNRKMGKIQNLIHYCQSKIK